MADKLNGHAGDSEFNARETATNWLVSYGPKPGTDLFGGVGELQIDKKSGEVRLLRGFK